MLVTAMTGNTEIYTHRYIPAVNLAAFLDLTHLIISASILFLEPEKAIKVTVQAHNGLDKRKIHGLMVRNCCFAVKLLLFTQLRENGDSLIMNEKTTVFWYYI